jgi:hypothetical protein
VSFESDANFRDVREAHFQKHPRPRASTDDGMEMHFNEEQLSNALLSIRASFVSQSNVTDEREAQPLKQFI